MRGCTVSAPVQSCSLQLLTSTTNKFAAVELLTKQSLYFVVEGKSRAKELYAQTCAHLNSQGMLDGDLFGLAVVSDGEYLFVDPDNKLSKYAPKHWKSSNSYGLDSSNRPTLILYFRVQYYVDTSLLLRDDLTRHHYYLQLRDNVVARGLIHACSSKEVLYLLAGYALQADFGDYDCDQHAGAYFTSHHYFPREMVESDLDLAQTVPALHREKRGIGKAQAELQYITEASSLEASRLTHNAHLYRLKHRKQEPGNGTVYMAICAKGIEIYEENSTKELTATFLWNNIGKLCFDRKKFEIRALNWLTSGDKYTYYTNSDEKSKHLLFLCRVTHQFSMTIQPRLTQLKKKEEEERQRYRDCYMYPPSLAKLISVGHYIGHHIDQRVSVISNTSSNTTSGIVSDRVQSLDESEDDLELEIMINSPPAPSEESLAFAHLRDDDEEETNVKVANISTKQPKATCATPATTDGSQCSSSGSTVVVASSIPVVSNPPSEMTIANAKRRASTSSSLELGFSHTAQNSTISDTASTCAELDYSVQSAHTSSGVYTLTSSNTVESQTRSSETSGFTENSSDSLHHGVYVVASTDLYNSSSVAFPQEENTDGMRERSGSTGSIVSASGSFRGDGSDPSDCGPRDLLSAEELSDLIVGNGSSEIASGVYPCRATVSSTLDSDSDYVTLPPPPMPPPRTDSDTNYVMLEPSATNTSSSYNTELFTQKHLPHHYIPVSYNHAPLVEEANARFITTKPHINIITAQTSLVASTAPKSFAAPTMTYQTVNSVPNTGVTYNSVAGLRMYPPGDARTHPPTHNKGPGPYIGYTMPDPGANMKPSPIGPIIGQNNYLDVHASRNCAYLRSCSYMGQFSPPVPPPTVLHPRQPPPPPPHNRNMATVYTNQVTRGQIEQFRQQLYSDVDYVIYPLKDPAISKQEYMDAKQGSLLARAVHYPPVVPPPPYPYITSDTLMYRSTPNVASVAGNFMPFTKCSSNQTLNSEPSYLPGFLATSPLYSAASYSSSSTQSLRYEPLQHHCSPQSSGSFLRAKSDDNLLNSFEKPRTPGLMERTKYKRLPPPPPPPPYDNQVLDITPPSSKAHFSRKSTDDRDGMLDIRTLREKSKNLDLPLISALCNDRSLLKQTNAFVMPRHPDLQTTAIDFDVSKSTSPSKHGIFPSNKVKYPVSGLSTTQMCKPLRKVSASTHTHPHQGRSHVKLSGIRTNSSESPVKNRDPT